MSPFYAIGWKTSSLTFAVPPRSRFGRCHLGRLVVPTPSVTALRHITHSSRRLFVSSLSNQLLGSLSVNV